MGKKNKENEPSNDGLDCKPIGELMTQREFEQKLGSDIYNAVIQGNKYTLRTFIISQKNEDSFQNIIQYLPLLAASKNQVDILRSFVPISCANSFDLQKRTPLHYAAYYCHVDTVRFLLNETSIDHMIEDKVGYTAFQYSCVGGDTDIMDLILDKESGNTEINNDGDDISDRNFGINQESVPSFATHDQMMSPAMPEMAPSMRAMAPAMPEMSESMHAMPMAPSMRPMAPAMPEMSESMSMHAMPMAPSMRTMAPAMPEMSESMHAMPMAPSMRTMAPVIPEMSESLHALSPPARMMARPTLKMRSEMIHATDTSQADGPVMLNCMPQRKPDFNAPMVPEQILSMSSMDRIAVINEQSVINNPAQTFAQSMRPMRNNKRAIKSDFYRTKGSQAEEKLDKSKLTDKKKENIPKKFFLQSLVLAARRGNTKAVLRLLDDDTLGKEAQSGLGSGRNSLLHFLGRRISAQELGKLADCGLDITSRNTDGVRAFEEVPPPVLQEFLDLSVTAAPENIDEYVTESYLIKNPFLNKDHQNLDVTTLLEISNSLIHTKLIFHPVFFGICAIKWRYIRKYYWLLVLMSFIFAFVMSLITVMKVGNTFRIDNGNNKIDEWLIEGSKSNILICQAITCSLLLTLVVSEICNMLFHTLSIYIIRYLVLLACLLFELLLVFLFPVVILQENAYFVIFIPWLFVMYHICQHYSFAQYYSNFVQIAKTSLKIVFVFGSIPIAFALVFHIMMMKEKSSGGENNISAFDYFHSSSIKTIAMMMGDFSMEEFSTQYTNIQWSVTYTFFIICVSLILYNMINALAVSDTQKLNKRAEVFRMIALTRQILSLQNWIRFFNRFFPCFRFLNIPVIKDFTVNCKNYRWNIEKYTYETKEGANLEVIEDIEIRSDENEEVTPKYSLRSRCKYISLRCTSKFVEDLKIIISKRIPNSF